MALKLDMFLKGNYMPNLFSKFIKEVSLIKYEAEKLGIPYESYHPYYVLVYSYLKILIEERIIQSDKFVRGSFHRVWMLAEDTDDLRTTLQNQGISLTEYGLAVRNGLKTCVKYGVDDFQYQRNLKRLRLIVESIRYEAKEGKKSEIGLLERLAFFYNTLCYQDPSVTCDMNELWTKLNEDLSASTENDIYDARSFIPEIVKKTFQTHMKCYLCLFGTLTFTLEPEFYRHSILIHSSFRLQCPAEKCETRMVNRVRMEQHLIENHIKLVRSKPEYCRGCGQQHMYLLDLHKCEEKCAPSSSRISPYYWEKYYLIWEGQEEDGFTLKNYFFPDGNKKCNTIPEDFDQSIFDISFGSDFGSPTEDSKPKEAVVRAEIPETNATPTTDDGKGVAKKLPEPEKVPDLPLRKDLTKEKYGSSSKSKNVDDLESKKKKEGGKDEVETKPKSQIPCSSKNLDVQKKPETNGVEAKEEHGTQYAPPCTNEKTLEVPKTSGTSGVEMEVKKGNENVQLIRNKSPVKKQPETTSSLSRKRKESSRRDEDGIADIKRALTEQNEFFKAELQKLDIKMNQMISFAKLIKGYLEKKT